jgi:hypothetical protein
VEAMPAWDEEYPLGVGGCALWLSLIFFVSGFFLFVDLDIFILLFCFDFRKIALLTISFPFFSSLVSPFAWIPTLPTPRRRPHLHYLPPSSCSDRSIDRLIIQPNNAQTINYCTNTRIHPTIYLAMFSLFRYATIPSNGHAACGQTWIELNCVPFASIWYFRMLFLGARDSVYGHTNATMIRHFECGP